MRSHHNLPSVRYCSFWDSRYQYLGTKDTARVMKIDSEESLCVRELGGFNESNFDYQYMASSTLFHPFVLSSHISIVSLVILPPGPTFRVSRSVSINIYLCMNTTFTTSCHVRFRSRVDSEV